MQCSGVKLNGPFRGRPCNSVAHYVFRGKHYCASHRTIAAAAPEEFTAARATLGRRLVKQQEADARSVAQVDAFPEQLDENGSKLVLGDAGYDGPAR